MIILLGYHIKEINMGRCCDYSARGETHHMGGMHASPGLRNGLWLW